MMLHPVFQKLNFRHRNAQTGSILHAITIVFELSPSSCTHGIWHAVLQIAAMFRPVPTAPGHDLFPQGAHADCLYVLQDGEVWGPCHRFSYDVSCTSCASCTQ